jgi:exonuclease VII small subunit
VSHGIRDRIMATYRAEIESHKHNERDFTSLRAQIEDLQRRKNALEQSIVSFQGDFEAQIKSQEQVIASLNNELDILNHNNTDKSQESVEITEQTQAVRVEIS